MLPRPPRFPLFPYTTLFRSEREVEDVFLLTKHVGLQEALGFFQHGPLVHEVAADDEEAERLLRSEEHTSELQSRPHLVCRLLLEKKKQKINARKISH